MTLKLKKIILWVAVASLVISALALPATRLTARASAPKEANAPEAPQAVNAMPAPLASFEGLRRDQADAAFGTDSIKPDTSGDVGITRYIQAVNTSVAIFDKVGNLIVSSTFGTFWTGAATTTACDTAASHHGQPTVLYDHMAQRWVVMDVAYDIANINTGPYFYCIAVSNSAAVEAVDQFTGEVPDPLNPPDGDWWFYTLRVDNYLPSQPRMALWPDGYYVGADMIDIENNGTTRNPRGVRVWAFNRDDLVNGLAPFHFQTHYLYEAANYAHLVPANLNGNPPPTGTPGIFASIQPPNKFLLWELEVDWINNVSTFSAAPTTLYTANYSQEVGFVVDQFGTSEKLDVLGDQLTTVEYREVNGNAALWAAHTSWLTADQRTLRWYEIRNPNISPAIYQQGSYDPDQHSRWISSLGVDVEGNMAIGYSVSSSSMYPAIRYAGRLVNDPLNELSQGEATLYAGTTYQDDVNSINDGYWGTRSAMSSDPVDECVFWYANEYYSATEPTNPNRNWHTRIGWFRYPTCGSGSLLRVSLSTTNAQGNGSSGMEYESYSSSISETGRFVVFASEATNLVNGDTNAQWDVFLRDRDVDSDGIFDEAGQVATTRISVGPGGAQGNGKSWEVSISGNGRYIAYSSDANNLITGDTNGARDVFLYDRNTGSTTRVSVSTGGVQGNARSDQPSVSYDGHYVAFRSYATNLVANDTNDPSDIFVRDTWASQTTRVSVGPGGVQANAGSTNPAISGNGRYVAFASYATNLVAGDANGNLLDVFVYDRNLGVTELISAVDLTAATYGNAESYTPAINYDGNFVTFISRSTNLVVPAPVGNIARVYLRNRSLVRTKLISNSYTGLISDLDSYTPSISGDGRYIVYASDASNLDLTPDNNGVRDIFLHDRDIGLTTRISRSVNGHFPDARSHAPVISSNGRHIAFTSEATNLVGDDTNNKWDVFAYDRQATTVTFLTVGSNVPGAPGAAVYVPIRFTGSGQQIDTTTFSVDYDQTCLTFSSTPTDAVVFNLPGAFTRSYTFSAADTDGELDFSIYANGTPNTFLTDGTIATIRFTVSGACQAPPGASRNARVGFSSDPPASFANSGSSVRGRVSDGSVTVLAGLPGDCNGDTFRDAGDISAEVLEIFDGDGTAPSDTPLGSFVGNPVGCNPNQDAAVDAGDISCLVILIFGGGTCGGAAASSITTASAVGPAFEPLTLGSASQANVTDPKLAMPLMTTAKLGQTVNIPIRFESGGNDVTALTFSLNYDPAALTLVPTTPNTVTLSLPPGFTASILFDANDTGSELDVAVFSPSSAVLTDTTLMTVTFQVANAPAMKETSVDFAPIISFSTTSGTIPGSTQNGTVHLGPWEVYLPLVIKP
jgi:hypothetical protein